MKVIDPGHVYEVDELDLPQNEVDGRYILWPLSRNTITFVKREGKGYPGNLGHHAGTNIQEVLRILIDRVRYLNNQIPCSQNEEIVYSLRNALYKLEERAAIRHNRYSEFYILVQERVVPLESMPTCKKCGHIGCVGECHP